MSASNPRRFRLLVLDWDGTIMDSIGAIVDCTFAALAGIEGLGVPDRERVRHAIGMGLAETVETFFPGAPSELTGRVLDRYREHWIGFYKDRFDLFPGVRETLAELGRMGYLLAVATAKSRRGLERDFARSGLAPFFHASRTIDEAPSKPAPAMLFSLFGELGVAPREALMVGDTSWDLEMASNARCASVAVLSGAQPEELLARHGPLACLPDLTHLPAWLAGRVEATVDLSAAPIAT